MKKLLKIMILIFAGAATFFVVSAGTVFVLSAYFDVGPPPEIFEIASGRLDRFLAEMDIRGSSDDSSYTYDEEETYEETYNEAYEPIYEDNEENKLHIEANNIEVSKMVVDNSLLPWNLKLVNRYNFLDEDFMPYLAPIGGGMYFDARAADNLVRMLESARADGLSPVAVSSFRSIDRQRVLFNNQVNRRLNEGMIFDDAFDAARRVVAYPGSSEHNLGLAVDIVAANYRNLTSNFGLTDEGIWLAENAHHYGFILRYPYHKQHITNIIYEPWHFRYVGIEHATAMFERDLVLEEYVAELIFMQFTND